MPLRNYIKRLCLSFISDYQLAVLRKNSIYYADVSYGIMTNGHLNEYIIREFLEGLYSGLTDITCHPGYNPINRAYHAWGYQWGEETRALKSGGLKDLVKKLNIKLVNYAI